MKLQIIFWKENKSEFNRHLQGIPKPISNQSFFIWFRSYWYWTVKQEMKSKASHSGDICERNLGPKLTVKMPKITQSVYCLCLIICIKSVSYLNSVMIYCRYCIENYFLHTQMCLTMLSWMNWTIQMYLHMPNHIPIIKFIPKFTFEILITCFQSLLACLTTPTLND